MTDPIDCLREIVGVISGRMDSDDITDREAFTLGQIMGIVNRCAEPED